MSLKKARMSDKMILCVDVVFYSNLLRKEAMTTIKVDFEYYSGVKHKAFRNVRLLAGWTEQGIPCSKMRALPMIPIQAADGCPAFQAEISFDSGQVGQTFEWSVMVDAPGRPNVRGIMTEDGPFESSTTNRSFVLG